LLTPQPHFLFFKASLPVLGFLKRKTEELEVSKIYLDYCENNKEELELSNYFVKLFFNQQTATPQKVLPWARSLPGSSLLCY